jgi:hypothetical protein
MEDSAHLQKACRRDVCIFLSLWCSEGHKEIRFTIEGREIAQKRCRSRPKSRVGLRLCTSNFFYIEMERLRCNACGQMFTAEERREPVQTNTTPPPSQ